jgi:hypothetical protein
MQNEKARKNKLHNLLPTDGQISFNEKLTGPNGRDIASHVKGNFPRG